MPPGAATMSMPGRGLNTPSPQDINKNIAELTERSRVSSESVSPARVEKGNKVLATLKTVGILGGLALTADVLFGGGTGLIAPALSAGLAALRGFDWGSIFSSINPAEVANNVNANLPDIQANLATAATATKDSIVNNATLVPDLNAIQGRATDVLNSMSGVANPGK
jgi:hypothetical protein